MERILGRAQWPLKRLGAPRPIGKTIAVAGYLEVSRERLRCVREAGHLEAPAIGGVVVHTGSLTPSEVMETAAA